MEWSARCSPRLSHCPSPYRDSDADLDRRYREVHWVSRIQDALREDLFELHLQPIVPLTQTTVGECYEVLLRMRDADELISPGAFLPAAEKYSVSTQIDRWVVERTIALLKERPPWTADVDWVSINLSAHSIGDAPLLQFLKDALVQPGVAASSICFEITETAAVSDLPSAIAFIAELKALGCRFALDDFGAGFSSFGYLDRFDVDYIKIDGRIVLGIVDDPAHLVMVEAINRIARIRGKTTIAEYVENAAILDTLKGVGVGYVQGYHTGEPRPALELTTAAMAFDCRRA